MYTFDYHLDARSVVKERFVWMLYMGILFFLLYGTTNQYAALTSPHPSFWMEWERDIPFVESFIIPYMSSDIMFVIAFFLPYTRLELRILSLRILFIILLSSIFFLLAPLQFSFTKPPIENFSLFFDMLKADLPFNQMPSLHISFAIVLWASMRKYLKNRWLKLSVALWFWLISLSTLFVYQHHFIDLPTGALVGLLSLYLISEERGGRVLRSFTTPRSLKMALYYLVASIPFVFLSFTLSVWFIYLFLSLISISLVYAFGLNTLISNRYLYPLFLPYFIGNHLTWLYFKRGLTIDSKVEDGIYLGRYPTASEYDLIQERGAEMVLDLALEHPALWDRGIEIVHLPFLDQTIPDPVLLQKAVLIIEKHRESGIYIHCALGLSRSVLVVTAWLLYQGYAIEEAEEKIAEIRKNSIKSPYMRVALEIYRSYITNDRNERNQDYLDEVEESENFRNR